MKKALLVTFLVVLAASLAGFAYAKNANPDKHKYGGFDVTITHTGPGTGTFTIVGENSNGSVSVSGTFESLKNPETGEVAVHITFDEGSIVICADGTVYDLSREEFWYAADANAKRIIHTVINYIKGLMQS